jgi:hypothetical protein
MKRLVWILLAVVSTALAQVRPVAFPTLTHPACHCCKCHCDGSCGMAGCVPPAPARTLPAAEQPVSLKLAAARQVAVPVRRTGEKFFAVFVKSAAVSAATRAPDRVTPPAKVPRFAAHCSFLI